MKKKNWFPMLGVILMMTGRAYGQEVVNLVEEVVAEPSASDVLAFAVDNMFLLFAAVLVIFMQAGFAILESGLNHSKNTVNILMKNLMDFAIGVLLYFFIGYGIMYGSGNGFFAFDGMMKIKEVAVEAGSLTSMATFLFQAAFAATAATIVSGAVAGRMKFSAYMIYTVILTGIIYPISGYWKWGGGWLDQMGFYDFAGSIVVHAVGGFAGLAGAIVLGPRIGRFGKDKTAMPGHNLTFAALGVFILLIGWYGFNPGSQFAIVGADNTLAVMLIAVNTTLAAAAGAVGALTLSWIVDKKPDLTMALNGVLAGLVGITANCDGVSNGEAMIIGLIAGLLVFGGIKLLEVLKIDDPVGVWPVHGLCGLWGGIATGIFGTYPDGYGNMTAQITGSLVIATYAFVSMFILFSILKAIGLLRVSEEDEIVGLDLSEHGHRAYGEYLD